MWWKVSTNRYWSSPVRIKAPRNAGWLTTSQTAARSAAHTCSTCSATSRAVEFEVLPSDYRVGRDDLHRLVELVAEAGRQVRMPAHHRLHRVTQSCAIQRPGQGDVQLHRVQLTQIAVVVGGTGVEEQALLQRGQRQHVSDPVLLAQLVDLLLARAGPGEIRRGQPAAAAAHMRADAGQRLEPQPAEPLDLRVVQR